MRLIDADVLIENIIKSIPDLRKFSTKTVGEVIDNTPTVDAVPIIRCHECKNLRVDFPDPHEPPWCRHWGIEPDLGDYCSRAERKEE